MDYFEAADRRGWHGDNMENDMDGLTVQEIHQNAVDHGFYDEKKDCLDCAALILTEVGEAIECLRKGELKSETNENGKPVGFPSELADILIRIYDLHGACESGRVKQASGFNNKNPLHYLLAVASWIGSGDMPKAIGATIKLAEHMGIDIYAEVARKHEYNKSRPYKHGKLF